MVKVTKEQLKKLIKEELTEQINNPQRATSMIVSLINSLGPEQFAQEFIRAFGDDSQIRPVLSRISKDLNLQEDAEAFIAKCPRCGDQNPRHVEDAKKVARVSAKIAMRSGDESDSDRADMDQEFADKEEERCRSGGGSAGVGLKEQGTEGASSSVGLWLIEAPDGGWTAEYSYGKTKDEAIINFLMGRDKLSSKSAQQERKRYDARRQSDASVKRFLRDVQKAKWDLHVFEMVRKA